MSYKTNDGLVFRRNALLIEILLCMNSTGDFDFGLVVFIIYIQNPSVIQKGFVLEIIETSPPVADIQHRETGLAASSYATASDSY